MLKKRMQSLLAFTALIFFTNIAFAAQREEILDFHVDIIVNKNASIDVTETISAYAAGNVIKRGLLRALPTSYKDSYGIARHVRYELKSVTVDGKPANYHTQSENQFFKIYVGDRNIFLAPNVYVYQFQYHINDAINFLKDADELYWNVTGNDWSFPIERATATIRLPEEANISRYSAYTGKRGAKNKNYSTRFLAPNIIEFSTLHALKKGRGITIGVAWQKGIIIEPTWRDRVRYQFDAYEYATVPIKIAILVLLYYLLAWYFVGRDPDEGTIIPLFEAPQNISPSAARYISQMGFDNTAFTAAIVSLAVKGALEIKNDDSAFTLIKKSELPKNLTLEENALLAKLFTSGNTLKLTSSNATIIRAARSSLKNTLKSQFNGHYFITNTFYAIPGILLSLSALVATVTISSNYAGAAFAVVWLTGWATGCFFLVYLTYSTLKQAFFTRSFTRIVAALSLCVFCIPFLGGSVAGILIFSDIIPLFLLFLLFIIVLINIIFVILLKAPTLAGRKIMDQIAGFKLFLSTTEKYRLQQMHAPDVTPEVFEKYLPYAIAFGVETKWSERFDAYLKAAGMAQQTYHPAWYSGTRFSAANVAAFSSVLGSGINSSLTTASISSSSSGSGGGGFSGGGGGGGGGGGW